MLKPVGNYVLIEATNIEEVSEGGIVLPADLTDKEQAVESTGKIIAFGPTAFKRWKGCESPNWFDRAMKEMTDRSYHIEAFEALCDYCKWEDPEYPPHKQWGVEIGDMIEHRRYNAKDTQVEGHKNYRFIPDIEILGVIKDD